ncbi:MAG: hypothetical protein ACON4U_10545 [Myxococcota bacterium]
MTVQITNGLLNDFSNALGQYLFFWGCDAVHHQGNLLCEYGFERHKKPNVSGSSCYRTTFETDIVELHSLCVGRYSKEKPNLLFTRKYRQCWVYTDDVPPFPGQYDPSLVVKNSFDLTIIASLRFLEWMLDYENWIMENTQSNYRSSCFASFKKIPKSRTWLHPSDGMSWLKKYKENPADLTRAKRWKK